MLTKLELAKFLYKEVNASKEELIQFFHSNFYKEELSEEQYLSAYNSFITELDEHLLNNKEFNLDKTFLKDRTFTSLKIPVKVRKQMELDYKEAQAYIEKIIKEMNE
jgi:hypothetical protein